MADIEYGFWWHLYDQGLKSGKEGEALNILLYVLSEMVDNIVITIYVIDYQLGKGKKKESLEQARLSAKVIREAMHRTDIVYEMGYNDSTPLFVVVSRLAGNLYNCNGALTPPFYD